MTLSNSRCATFTTVEPYNVFTDFPVRYVPLEGAAGLIFKTRSAAICDSNNIPAMVRFTDVKHDGRSQGLVTPNVKAQIVLLEKATLAPAEIEFTMVTSTGFVGKSQSLLMKGLQI